MEVAKLAALDDRVEQVNGQHVVRVSCRSEEIREEPGLETLELETAGATRMRARLLEKSLPGWQCYEVVKTLHDPRVVVFLEQLVDCGIDRRVASLDHRCDRERPRRSAAEERLDAPASLLLRVDFLFHVRAKLREQRCVLRLQPAARGRAID